MQEIPKQKKYSKITINTLRINILILTQIDLYL